MTKAGKNLEILRTGWTFNGRVHTIGEVVPLPPGLQVKDEEEQQEYYGGKVFYRLTDKPVNIGLGGKSTWKPTPEPKDVEERPGYLTVEGLTDVGGGAASFTPSSKATPRSELPDELPEEITKKLKQDAAHDMDAPTSRKKIILKKRLRVGKTGRLVAATATKLSSRR